MDDNAFDARCLWMGQAMDAMATELHNNLGLHAEYSSFGRGGGCMLRIQKTSMFTERDKGSFAVKNDPDPKLVRIEISDTRKNSGIPIATQVEFADLTPDALRARVDGFVKNWRAG
jgi:hypothetical protein